MSVVLVPQIDSGFERCEGCGTAVRSTTLYDGERTFAEHWVHGPHGSSAPIHNARRCRRVGAGVAPLLAV